MPQMRRKENTVKFWTIYQVVVTIAFLFAYIVIIAAEGMEDVPAWILVVGIMVISGFAASAIKDLRVELSRK